MSAVGRTERGYPFARPVVRRVIATVKRLQRITLTVTRTKRPRFAKRRRNKWLDPGWDVRSACTQGRSRHYTAQRAIEGWHTRFGRSPAARSWRSEPRFPSGLCEVNSTQRMAWPVWSLSVPAAPAPVRRPTHLCQPTESAGSRSWPRSPDGRTATPPSGLQDLSLNIVRPDRSLGSPR